MNRNVRVASGVGCFTFILHAATAWRYGYFRDELYFIACAKHLAWGYVDQPPLVAVAAAAAAPFAYHLLALRILPILAATLTAVLAVRIARELGGNLLSQCMAGLVVALTPANLLLGNTLTTTSFEPLSWTLVMWCVLRIVRGGEWRWWLALTGSLAFGLYGKYSIALLALSLLIGLALTPQRRVLATRWLPLAAATTVVLTLPNLLWQHAHGWPMFAVLHGDATSRHSFTTGLQLEYGNLARNGIAFLIEQVLYTNPVAAPLWIIGVLAPFRVPALRDLRFLSWTYVALIAQAVVFAAKGYYIIGVYPAMFVVGSLATQPLFARLRAVRYGYAALVLAVAATILPLVIPLLPIERTIAYSQLLGLTGRNGTPPRLVQPIFAEEFGWERLARDVSRVYDALPPAQRARTAIFADTYADAGAIDFYGPRYGLPQAIASQNSYFLWGTRGYDGATLVAIGATRVDVLRRYYRRVTLVATSDEPLKWVVEGPAPIYLCTEPIAPLSTIWPNLGWFGA